MQRAKGNGFDGAQDGTSDVFADIADNTIVVYSATGVIAEKNALVIINKAGVAAMTLARPMAGVDNGKTLKILSDSAYAHTITCTSGFDGGGTTLITFAAAVGSAVTLKAYNGYWYIGGTVTATYAAPGVTAYTTSTAITQKSGTITIGSGGALSMTLAAPAAGTDDGKILTVIGLTAHAHTLTVAANFDGTNHIATYAAIGNNIVLMALNGAWYMTAYTGVTLS
jgi:hypothetical protein